jgi:hypothetical protein
VPRLITDLSNLIADPFGARIECFALAEQPFPNVTTGVNDPSSLENAVRDAMPLRFPDFVNNRGK